MRNQALTGRSAGFAGFCWLSSNPPRARACARAHTDRLKPSQQNPANPARMVTGSPVGRFAPVAVLPASVDVVPLAIRPETSPRALALTVGRPERPTRLGATSGEVLGPGDDDGAGGDGGQLDPYEASTLSPYEAALDPYRGSLLDVPEPDETEASARGCAGPTTVTPAVANATRRNRRNAWQSPRHPGRNLASSFRSPPRNSVGGSAAGGGRFLVRTAQKSGFVTGGASPQSAARRTAAPPIDATVDPAREAALWAAVAASDPHHQPRRATPNNEEP